MCAGASRRVFAGSNFRSTFPTTKGWCSPALPTNVYARFLFLDQPSQVYFPAEKDVDGSMSLVSEDDRLAVSRMFRLVFDAVKEVAPGLQVLITEHADINDAWYQAAVVERWRGGLKLVPEDWPTN